MIQFIDVVNLRVIICIDHRVIIWKEKSEGSKKSTTSVWKTFSVLNSVFLGQNSMVKIPEPRGFAFFKKVDTCFSSIIDGVVTPFH